MKRKTIVTILLILITMCAPIPLFSQFGTDFVMDGTRLVGYRGSGGNVTIPAGVTVIRNSAFSGAYPGDDLGITRLTIPASVTSIEHEAGTFSFCGSLESITVDANNPSYASESGILYNKAKTNLLVVPRRISGNVTIPASVTSIDHAFFSTRLTGITVDTQNSEYSSVEGVLFNKDRTVLIAYPFGKQGSSYTIPAGVTSIASGAFGSYFYGGNTNITSITIPSSVTSIGGYAFSNCSNLANINIPAGVTTVEYGAFYGCNALAPAVSEEIRRRFDETPFWGQ